MMRRTAKELNKRHAKSDGESRPTIKPNRDSPRAPKDPRIAEAYLIHKRFVMQGIVTRGILVCQPVNLDDFSSFEETKIVREGNLFE